MWNLCLESYQRQLSSRPWHRKRWQSTPLRRWKSRCTTISRLPDGNPGRCSKTSKRAARLSSTRPSSPSMNPAGDSGSTRLTPPGEPPSLVDLTLQLRCCSQILHLVFVNPPSLLLQPSLCYHHFEIFRIAFLIYYSLSCLAAIFLAHLNKINMFEDEKQKRKVEGYLRHPMHPVHMDPSYLSRWV